MTKSLLIISAILLYSVCCKAQNPNQLEYSHYNIRLELIPEQQFIRVDGSLKYVVNEDSVQQLTFHLHKNFEINYFKINGDNSFQIDTSSTVRWLPDALKIIYSATGKFQKGDVLNVDFSYQGNINEWPAWSANVIDEEWVEMGLYFPWYPSINEDFTYKLTVDINPEYTVFARGNYSEKGNTKIFENDNPVFDLVVCASKDLKIRKLQLLNQSFQVVNSKLSEAVVDSIQSDIENLYKFYNTMFGEIEVQDMCLVISKREKGGGYSRKGGLFLGGISDSDYLSERIDYNRFLAHEISHFWWVGAPLNWEDWLNESFAEYSALLLIREIYGNEEYNKRMKLKQKESVNTPPIWGLARNDEQATEVLYSKGVILLSELEQKTGNEKFLELCKERIRKKVNNTNDFLNLIADIEGKNTANWFEQSLRTR